MMAIYFLIIVAIVALLESIVVYVNYWGWKLHIYEVNPVWRWVTTRRIFPFHLILHVSIVGVTLAVLLTWLSNGGFFAFFPLGFLVAILMFLAWNDSAAISSYKKKCVNCPNFKQCRDFYTTISVGCAVSEVRNRAKVYQSIRDLKEKGEL